MLHEGKFASWRIKLDSYFLSIDENIFLSVEYGVKDDFNDKAKKLFFMEFQELINYM